MLVSELTVDDLTAYLRMESDDIDATTEAELTAYLEAARSYASQYTGRSVDELDNWAECAVAVLCVAADYYSDRDMVRSLKGTGTTTQNAAVQSILDMHKVNLVAGESTATLTSTDDDEDEEEESDEET